jgi:hypothetical protein
MAGAGYKVFASGDVLSASDVNTYFMQQTVMVFANASARTTALSSVLAEGMVSYLQDTNSLEVYDGSAWVGATGDITGLTAGTGVSITSATGPVPTVAIDTAVVPRLGVANTFTTSPQQINALSSTIGFIVRANATTPLDLTQWQNSGGTALSIVDFAGRVGLRTGGSVLSSTLAVSPSSASAVAVTVRGAASQTANLQEWQDSAGSVVAAISAGGSLGIGRNAGSGVAAIISTGAVGNVGLMVDAVASQTGDLQQWRNSSGTVLAKVDKDGFITAPRVLTTNGYGALREINSGGFLQLFKQNAAGPNLGSGFGAVYLRDGTNAGTLKLVIRAGASGAETTILDNIPQ